MGSVNSNFLPATTGLTLGNVNQQWTLYASNIFAAVMQTTSANPAQSGIIRLAEGDTIGWRNNANTGDLLLGSSGAGSGNTPADSLTSTGGFSGNLYNSVIQNAQSETVVPPTPIFDNSVEADYLSCNINGINPRSEFNIIQGNPGCMTNAVIGAVAVPNGATTAQVNAVAGIINNASGTEAVAIYGQARAVATNSHVFGANFVAADAPGVISTIEMIGVEIDIDNQNAASSGQALLLQGTVQPGNAGVEGIVVGKPATGFWNNGLHFQQGSVNTGIKFDTGATTATSGSVAALFLNPVASGLGQSSQGITLVSSDPVAGQHVAGFYEDPFGTAVVSALGTALPKILVYNGVSTVSQGVPSEVAVVNLIGQNAAIATTTLFTPAADGRYRVSWNAKLTTAAGSSSTLGALTIVYTDPDGVTVTVTCGAQITAGTIATTSTANTTGTVLLGLPMLLNCKAGTAITYAFAYASSAANAMIYKIHLILEAL